MACVVCLLVLSTSCSWLKGETKKAVADVVDCTTKQARSAIKQYGPTVESVVVDTLDAAGRADWNKIKSATSGLSAPSLSVAERAVGGCVMQAVINRLLDPVLSNPDAPQSELIQVDKGELAAGWDQLRAQSYGGARFAGAE